jgi:hypothetical protein
MTSDDDGEISAKSGEMSARGLRRGKKEWARGGSSARAGHHLISGDCSVNRERKVAASRGALWLCTFELEGENKD